jgi:beta-mannosidase
MGSIPDISLSNQWSWEPAAIPFDAISWLSYTGRGPDPLVENNDRLYRWTEDNDWVLRKRFAIPDADFSADDEIQIVVNRLDCYFDLFLNGHYIGHGRNQFRNHTLDIEELVRPQDNELLIYIRSARNVNSMMEAAYGQLPAGFDTGRVHARRCQSLTGWDWTARLSSVSLLESPVIKRNSPIQIFAPYAYVAKLPAVLPGQEIVESVQLSVSIDLSSRRRATGNLIIRITDLTSGELVAEKQESIVIKPKTVQIRRSVEVQNAKLWWSLGIGAQPLYKIEFRLEATDRLEQTYDLHETAHFGIRTIAIEQAKDEEGESFVPILNGTSIFCRGANWIPVSILPVGATSADYRTLLTASIGAGINCLRVWGGGIYETDEFYEICDQAGILVWQDFMFTCAAYPTYREFLDEVEAEVIYQLTRLRNHASIMLWCGNNENEWLHQTGGLKKGSEQKVIGETIWTHLIRQMVEDNDTSRYYHQSSPYGKNKTDFNDQGTGDRHSWEAWADWQHTDVYLLDTGRFISEFGLQALPDIESIRQFAPGADNMDNTSLCNHQKMIEGQQRLARYVSAHYATPAGLEHWVKTTQDLQAEILRRAVEHWRRRRFKTAGALIWQLHDAYPAISWSIIDYYRRPKQAYKAMQRFFSPVLLTMELSVGGIEASVVPPEMWPTTNPETVPAFPIEGGNRLVCEAGAPVVQAKFAVINDTAIHLRGEMTVQFLRSETEPVVLDTVTVDVEPNGMQIALTHEIGASMLKDIHQLTVRAHVRLDEVSQTKLQELGNAVRAVQRQIAASNAVDFDTRWEFHEETGLELRAPFVDFKYFAGDLTGTK